MINSDVVIVGGGMIGLSLAWRLLQGGARVRVIDAGADIPSSSAAAAGMLSPSFEHRRGAESIAETLYSFASSSLQAWPSFAAELEEEAGVDIDFQLGGVMGAAFGEAELAEKQTAYASLKRRGAPAEWLSGPEALRKAPSLAKDVKGAFFAANEGQTDPRRTLAALGTAVEKRGGVISTGVVTRIIEDSGRVSGVVTNDGDRYDAGIVVIAAGALLSTLSPGLRQTPVFPVKGEALAVDGRSFAGDKSDLPNMIIRTSAVYLCPKGDGRIIIGASEKPDDATLSISDDAISDLRKAAIRVAPTIERLPEIERWAGLRPGTPDAGPLLGGIDSGPKGLVYAVGHFRNGILLAPKTAEILAARILGGTSARHDDDAILNAFNPLRFESGQ